MQPSILLGVACGLWGLACSSTDGAAPDDGSKGGSDSGTGNGGATSRASGGGGGSSGAGAGGQTSGAAGGRTGSGGLTGASGSSSVSGGAGGAGAGGAAAGGSGGTSTGGAGGTGGAVAASAGCGKSGRPTGGLVTVANDHYFAFPASYDGKVPMPVLIGFHGCGVNRGDGTNSATTEYINVTKGTAFETEYVRAVPVSADTGGCWSYNTDISRIAKMYDDLLASYCVDKNRVFATGHSSGAQMIVQILLQSHKTDAQHLNFKGVAPVAASDYGVVSGPIPVMYIQGKMDQERGGGDGHETVARLRTANTCSDTSKPYSQVMGCQSGATTVVPGCITYDGCKAPTIWCSHNDPAYSGTMHGIPCFGMKAIYDFFESLP